MPGIVDSYITTASSLVKNTDASIAITIGDLGNGKASITISGINEQTAQVLPFVEEAAFGVSVTVTDFGVSVSGGTYIKVPGLLNQAQSFYRTADALSYTQSATTFTPFSSANVTSCTSSSSTITINSFVDAFTALSAAANSTEYKVKTYSMTLSVGPASGNITTSTGGNFPDPY
jgi:hypothetical protein